MGSLWRNAHSLLFHHLWYLFVVVFAILWCENDRIIEDPQNFSVLNVLFEVSSAYGGTGASIGFPNVAYSFSGVWTTFPKLLIISLLLLGRQRGLVTNIDAAVQLPDENDPHYKAADSSDDEAVGDADL